MKKCFTQSFILTSVTTLILFFCLQLGFAQVRSSSNYQLQSDSINIGGGFSSSTSYIQESTVGEVATGISDSSSYSLRAGYQQMQEVYISMTTDRCELESRFGRLDWRYLKWLNHCDCHD
jgi:hypothetical protein